MEIDRYVSSLQASAPSPKEVSEGNYVGADAFRLPPPPFLDVQQRPLIGFLGGFFRIVQLTKEVPHVRGRLDAAPLGERKVGRKRPICCVFSGLKSG